MLSSDVDRSSNSENDADETTMKRQLFYSLVELLAITDPASQYARAAASFINSWIYYIFISSMQEKKPTVYQVNLLQ